ncbi:ankyrin repeat domain-containing protein SOWAHB [Chanos chanos]|uniref:Ankyrin repeat domain-containing protein SOWAHB n=1 Tax=Chanos chanos TaxID=29144 RepID=A0A6J2UUN5_CHACN|nr:ankyrin repeat domain-containing protein SOWAHB [Chanos chanos]
MATEFTQESVLRFLISNGGNVRNADLLTHYKSFLREDEEREQNRELFKRYVNSVATVKQEDGVSRVVLRKKYRRLIEEIGDSSKPKIRAEKQEPATQRLRDASPKPPAVSRNNEDRQVASKTKPTLNRGKELQIPALDASQNTVKTLPVAGIINSNNNVETVSFEKTVKTSSPCTREHIVSSSDRINVACAVKPSQFNSDSKRSSGSGQSFEHSWDFKGSAESTGLEHNDVYIRDKLGLEQSREGDGCSQFHCQPQEYSLCEVRVFPPEEVLRTTKPDDSFQPSQRGLEEPAARVLPLHTSLAQTSRISGSSPCISTHVEILPTQPYLELSRSNGNLPSAENRLKDIQRHVEALNEAEKLPHRQYQRNSLPLDAPYTPSRTEFSEHHTTSLSSSHDSLHPPSSYRDPIWPFSFSREEWYSDDNLSYGSVSEERQMDHGHTSDMQHHTHEVKLLSQMHRAVRHVTPWHHSTGHLDDESSRSESPPRSTPGNRLGPLARRVSQRLRSRVSRSLGEDLDRPFPDDCISARQSRLQLLSSSLSVNYPLSTLSGASSCRNLSTSGGGSNRSLCSVGHDNSSYPHRHAQVPLEPKEHDWFFKAATGTWPDIYSLFREEPSLLDRKDFVSGFTVLHWIAKHGDHRVLNTLWYGVNKVGMNLDVDARTSCGYTPLHLASIHGHKKLIRLLVTKFKANVNLRDTSGKKPWQYLDKNGPRDLLELLRAPSRITGSTIPKSSVEQPVQKLRPISAAAHVKRHSSFAALFKHKSIPRLVPDSEAFV